jgi:hypothetical protein
MSKRLTAAEVVEKEQCAFDGMIDDLLEDHAGQIALVKDHRPVGFFPARGAAYAAAIERFGADSAFLISEVSKPDIEPTSISWCWGAISVEA